MIILNPQPLPQTKLELLKKLLQSEPLELLVKIAETKATEKEVEAVNKTAEMKEFPQYEKVALAAITEAHRYRQFISVLNEFQQQTEPFQTATLTY